VISLTKYCKKLKFPQSLRAVNHLYTTGKLFQNFTLKKFQRQGEESNFLNVRHLSFRAPQSTKLQCISLTDHVTLKFIINVSMPAVFLDIEKAFDTTWHPVFLYSLYKLHFSASLMKLIYSFLSNREFRVMVKGGLSTPQEYNQGYHKFPLCPNSVQPVYK